jgi:GTP-binding protein
MSKVLFKKPMSGKIFSATQFVTSAYSAKQLGIADAEVAFVGLSNAGKSSLLNALCRHRQLAKVSKTPGKTRVINVFSVKHGRWIVDLPGYGYSAGSEKERLSWEKMITGYITGRPTLKAIFVLVDISSGAKGLDLDTLSWLKSLGMPYHVVANKIDRIPVTKLNKELTKLAQDLKTPPEEIIPVSARTGTGTGRLRAVVSSLLGL